MDAGAVGCFLLDEKFPTKELEWLLQVRCVQASTYCGIINFGDGGGGYNWARQAVREAN